MRALITGASSGIGKEFALQLSRQGMDLVLVARNKKALETLKDQLSGQVKVKVIAADLTQDGACQAVYDAVQDLPVDLLINNAGFGLYGPFDQTDLETELNMIDLNIRAVHSLTKLFLKRFIAADRGTILTVSSISAFLPGPLMATYYASKAYVQRLTEALHEELRQKNSSVRVHTLCPGPVRTPFNDRAGAGAADSGLDSRLVVSYALKQMGRGRLIIIPGWPMRLMRFGLRFVPTRLQLWGAYKTQTIRRGQQ